MNMYEICSMQFFHQQHEAYNFAFFIIISGRQKGSIDDDY